MFNSEFYPTPRNVIDQMQLDCTGKICLEPSAGKGDIVDYLKEYGAAEVSACELNDDLRTIVANKATVIGSDFLSVTSEQISHVQLIVMNPPFSNADKHILHAWEIAPEGCEIVSLCNWETVGNMYYRSRSELGQIIENYGASENLGDCFTNAERKTGVEVGLVRLFKPIVSDNFNWDGFYYTDDDLGSNAGGVMPYSRIRSIVNTYVGAVKCWDKFEAAAEELSRLAKGVNFGDGFSFKISYSNEVKTKLEFSRALQIRCWNLVFEEMNVQKYVTRGVREDLNRFIQSRHHYPFTMRNVYKMIEIIFGTREHTMNRAICEAVENYTKHTHENRYSVEGWKTNESHLLAQKFIVPYMVKHYNYGNGEKFELNYGRYQDDLNDLIKAICYIQGYNYDTMPTPIKTFNDFKNANMLETNRWYESGLFNFKFFKKGTMHLEFVHDKDWEALNRAYAKIKGMVLPETLKEKKHKQEQNMYSF